MSVVNTKEYTFLIDKLQRHATRFAEFRRPPAVPDADSSTEGHYNFDIPGLSYDDIQKAFIRQSCFDEAVKGWTGDEPKGALYYKDFALQNDVLSSAERSFLENSRTRIRQSVYATAIKRGHGSRTGIFYNFVQQSMQMITGKKK